MKHFKDYLVQFIRDESGMEFIQWIVIIAVVAAVAVPVMALGTSSAAKVEEAQGLIDGLDITQP